MLPTRFRAVDEVGYWKYSFWDAKTLLILKITRLWKELRGEERDMVIPCLNRSDLLEQLKYINKMAVEVKKRYDKWQQAKLEWDTPVDYEEELMDTN